MGDAKDLGQQDAIAKIKEIAEGKMTMLCSFAGDGALHARPLSTQLVDPDGSIHFLSGKSSGQNREVAANPKVHLIYQNPSSSEYMVIDGSASIGKDPKKIGEVWTPLAKAWFKEGKEDPELTLLTVKPTAGHYWDTKTNKVIQLAHIAISALTGKTFEDGVSGDLRIA